MNLQEAASVFRTVGWRESLAPAIQERVQGALLQLASANRPKDMSDDGLRGHIAALIWILDYPERINRALKELEGKAADAEPPQEPPAAGSPHEPESE